LMATQQNFAGHAAWIQAKMPPDPRISSSRAQTLRHQGQNCSLTSNGAIRQHRVQFCNADCPDRTGTKDSILSDVDHVSASLGSKMMSASMSKGTSRLVSVAQRANIGRDRIRSIPMTLKTICWVSMRCLRQRLHQMLSHISVCPYIEPSAWKNSSQ
jgi:hypothetical protein